MMTGIWPSLHFYHAPGSCSRVTLNALEEIGLSYEDTPIDIFKGQQRSPSYLAVNPKGKVPTLVWNGRILTETPAILWHLSTRFPEARLLPSANGQPDTEILADLAWVASTLHPLARTALIPQRSTKGDPEPVRLAAAEQLVPLLDSIESRLGASEYWYGSDWSIMDVYIQWLAGMAGKAGVSAGQTSAISSHGKRIVARPSFERARERERAAAGRAGITLPDGDKL
jgi:glutathione S-transferase